MTRERLVVVGADAAGMAAASQARKRRGPDDLQIIALERGHWTSYSACGIPYWISGVVPDPQRLVVRWPEEFQQRQQIDARTLEEVVGIDLAAGRVTVRRLAPAPGQASEYVEGFDQLVLATGAVPVRPDWPGAHAEGIFGIQTLDDGSDVIQALRLAPQHAVVVGGGYVGVEMAEALAIRGLAVTLLEAGEQPMATLDPDMGAKVRDAMEGLGIDVRTGERVVGFETGPDARVAAVATEHRTYPADLVVLGLGVRPNTSIAADAGVGLGPTDGIRTDRMMRSVSHDQVWAAGDCVETYHRVSRQPVHIPLGTHANKQGRVAGINIGGGYATFPGVVGTAISKVFDLEIARTGLRERDCQAAGLRYVTTTVDSSTQTSYMPGSAPITVKLIAEWRTGRLLGGQIVGRDGAAKRIDAIAIALWNGMTVEEMSGLDLAYAPPFAPVWDPVLIAARKAEEGLHGKL